MPKNSISPRPEMPETLRLVKGGVDHSQDQPKKSNKTHPQYAVPGAVRGRPPRYSRKLGRRICDAIIDHLSLRKALREIPDLPSSSTIYNWLYDGKHQEFARQYELTRMLTAEIMLDEMRDIANECPMRVKTVIRPGGIKKTYSSIDPVGIARNRLRVKTLQWIMSKVSPRKYGNRVYPETQSDLGVYS